VPISDKRIREWSEKNGLPQTKYIHYIFGGEVYDPVKDSRYASDDLIIIEQEPYLESRFMQISGSVDDETIPRCALPNDK